MKMIRKNLLVLAASAMAGALPATAPAETVTCDFDALNGGFLPKRDGWESIVNPCYPEIVFDESPCALGPVLALKGGAGGIIRLAETPPFNPVPKRGWMEMDIQWNGPAQKERSAVLAMGANDEFRQKPDMLDLSPRFGLFSVFSEEKQIQVNQFVLVIAAGDGKEKWFRSVFPDSIREGDWLRVRLEFDFAGKNGDSFGNLLFKNLTQKDETFSETGIQGVDLHLKDIPGKAADPANWNAWFLRLVNTSENGGTSMPVDRIAAGSGD